MQHRVIAAAASVAIAISAAQLPAAIIYWQGGTAGLASANYTLDGPAVVDGNDNLAPAADDLLRIGLGGTATHSATPLSVGTLWVGQNEAVNAGNGTVTIDGGATVSLTGGAAGSANAGLIVGHTRNGTLNIDGAGTTVTSNRLIVIGFANSQAGRNGTINVTNGASLIATDGNINIGDGGQATGNGMQGHLVVNNGAVSAMGGGADLTVGVRKSTSSVTLTGGTIDIADVIEVGFGGNGVDPGSTNTSYNVSGGVSTNGGNFFVGRAASIGATVNLSGTGIINVGGRYLMGAHTATGVTTNHTGGTLNTTLDVRVGDAGTTDSTYHLSGNGIINATTGMMVGRQGTGVFNQTGGTVNLTGTDTQGSVLSIGNREAAPNPASGLYTLSAGSLNATASNPTGYAVRIAANGTGELRVIGGDGAIDINGDFLNDTTANGTGTLAFALQNDESLSLVDVSGVATFASGSVLGFSLGDEDAPLGSYDLLTASSIVDSGLTFAGPAGWSYQIVGGGNGQILQAVVPEPGALGLLGMASLLGLARRRRA